MEDTTQVDQSPPTPATLPGNNDNLETTPTRTAAMLFCHVCQSVYRQPKLLPCLHSVCRDCLQDTLDRKSTSDKGQRPEQETPRLECPVCGYVILLPPSGIPGLPDNPLLSRLCVEYMQEVKVRGNLGSRHTSGHDGTPDDVTGEGDVEVTSGTADDSGFVVRAGRSDVGARTSGDVQMTSSTSRGGLTSPVVAIRNMSRLQNKIMGLQEEALRVTGAIERVSESTTDWEQSKEDLKRAINRRVDQFQHHLSRVQRQMLSQIDKVSTQEHVVREADRAKVKLRSTLGNILHEVDVLKGVQDLGTDDEIHDMVQHLLTPSRAATDVRCSTSRYSLVTPSTSIEESLLAAFGELQLCQEEMLVFSPHSLDYTDVQVAGQDSDTGGSMEDKGNSRGVAEHVGGDSFGSVKVDDIYSAVAKKGFFDNRNDESDNSIGNISRNKSTSESEVVETNTKAVSRQSAGEQQQKEEEPPTGGEDAPAAHKESEAYKKVSPRGRPDRNSRRHKTDLGLQTSEVQDYLLHIQNARESLADRRREILRRGQMARERSLSRDGRLNGPDERTSPSAAQTPHSNSSLVTKDSIAGASNDPADTIIRFHFQTGRRQSHTARSDIIDVPSPVVEEDRRSLSLHKKTISPLARDIMTGKVNSLPKDALRSESTSSDDAFKPDFEKLTPDENCDTEKSSTSSIRTQSVDLSSFFLSVSPNDDLELRGRSKVSSGRPARRAISNVADKRSKIEYLRESWHRRKEMLIQNEGFVPHKENISAKVSRMMAAAAQSRSDTALAGGQTEEGEGQSDKGHEEKDHVKDDKTTVEEAHPVQETETNATANDAVEQNAAENDQEAVTSDTNATSNKKKESTPPSSSQDSTPTPSVVVDETEESMSPAVQAEVKMRQFRSQFLNRHHMTASPGVKGQSDGNNRTNSRSPRSRRRLTDLGLQDPAVAALLRGKGQGVDDCKGSTGQNQNETHDRGQIDVRNADDHKPHTSENQTMDIEDNTEETVLQKDEDGDNTDNTDTQTVDADSRQVVTEVIHIPVNVEKVHASYDSLKRAESPVPEKVMPNTETVTEMGDDSSDEEVKTYTEVISIPISVCLSEATSSQLDDETDRSTSDIPDKSTHPGEETNNSVSVITEVIDIPQPSDPFTVDKPAKEVILDCHTGAITEVITLPSKSATCKSEGMETTVDSCPKSSSKEKNISSVVANTKSGHPTSKYSESSVSSSNSASTSWRKNIDVSNIGSNKNSITKSTERPSISTSSENKDITNDPSPTVTYNNAPTTATSTTTSSTSSTTSRPMTSDTSRVRRSQSTSSRYTSRFQNIQPTERFDLAKELAKLYGHHKEPAKDTKTENPPENQSKPASNTAGAQTGLRSRSSVESGGYQRRFTSRFSTASTTINVDAAKSQPSDSPNSGKSPEENSVSKPSSAPPVYQRRFTTRFSTQTPVSAAFDKPPQEATHTVKPTVQPVSGSSSSTESKSSSNICPAAKPTPPLTDAISALKKVSSVPSERTKQQQQKQQQHPSSTNPQVPLQQHTSPSSPSGVTPSRPTNPPPTPPPSQSPRPPPLHIDFSSPEVLRHTSPIDPNNPGDGKEQMSPLTSSGHLQSPRSSLSSPRSPLSPLRSPRSPITNFDSPEKERIREVARKKRERWRQITFT